MDNFRLNIPTDLIFGKDSHKEVGKEVSKYGKNVLVVRLKESTLKTIGIYDDIILSLKENNINYIEFDGILPNPRLSRVDEGAKLCKEKNIDFILAIGGGSVIDSAKSISAAACIEGSFWDIITGKTKFEKYIPYGTISTYPATASEMNARTVIVNDETLYKGATSVGIPTFSILNPEVCKSLPKKRMSQGIVDMLAHSMERYFTNTTAIDLTDRMLEGVMKTIISLGLKYTKEGYSYDIASQLTYAATVSHNYTLCVGRETDFASHKIGHELSGFYDVPHGESLSIIFPAWLKYVKNHNKERMAKFFIEVFDVNDNINDLDLTITKGIEKLENFYKELDMPTRLIDLKINDLDIEKLVKSGTMNDTITLGFYVKLNSTDVREIYKLAYK
ncbi:MAG: iron-containing alcohol dehydrogenase [Lachnospirales bacterium]